MAVKRKRRRVKKRHAKGNPKKTRRRKKRRNPLAVANPRRRHKRRRHGARVRRAHANPKHRTKARRRRRHKRNPLAMANPRHKRRHHKRRSRRNPGLPIWAMAGLAGLAGLANAGSFALTQRTDPSLATLQRNRYIAGGLMAAAGVALAFVSPVIGAGVAAGGFASLFGSQLAIAAGNVLDKKTTPAPQTVKGIAYSGIHGVFGPPMQGVYGDAVRLGDWNEAGYASGY